VVAGWPQFANRRLDKRLQNGNANIKRMRGKTDLYMQAILTALPGALFFLMPVFALVLRIAYIPRPMGYLEHLVVALYSPGQLRGDVRGAGRHFGVRGNTQGMSAANPRMAWIY